MFYYLDGTVAEILPYLAVIDCGGVGYAVSVTHNTLAKLSVGDKAKLYISEIIRDEVFDLYGFADKNERRCFELLLSVSGLGPKAALSILSANTPEGLALAIMNNNEKALTVAPGVGKKIAQRVILELKDKMKLEDAFELKLAHEQERAAVGAGEVSDGRQEAVEALVALGYSSADALRAVRKVTDVPPDDVEGLLKAALKNF